MKGSRQVASLFGLVLTALALSDAAKLRIWTSAAPAGYLPSAGLILGGVALVLVPDRWTGGREALVTMAGWLAITGGLAWHVALLGWPAVVWGLSRFLAAPWFGGGQAPDVRARLAGIDVLLASGLLLTIAAYRVRRTP